jgi:crotonobetainyl-CoA:carnitine CoA-transferase CaiB-like acyl-CoA transferase
MILLGTNASLSVPFGPINNIAETFSHPQAMARRVVVEVEVMLRFRIGSYPTRLKENPDSHSTRGPERLSS